VVQAHLLCLAHSSRVTHHIWFQVHLQTTNSSIPAFLFDLHYLGGWLQTYYSVKGDTFVLNEPNNPIPSQKLRIVASMLSHMNCSVCCLPSPIFSSSFIFVFQNSSKYHSNPHTSPTPNPSLTPG
jgi:hypothetical protein